MNRNLYLFPLLLLTTLTRPAVAQLRVTGQDSLALFPSEADQFERGRELLRAKGRVTHLSLRPQGGIDIAVLRQHIGYLQAPKPSGLRAGLSVLPALWTTTFGSGRFQPPAEQFISLTSGLVTPFPYSFDPIASLTGGIRTLGKPRTGEQAVPLATLLTTQPRDMGYEGPRQRIDNTHSRPYQPWIGGYGLRLPPPTAPNQPTMVIFGDTASICWLNPVRIISDVITTTEGAKIPILKPDGLDGQTLLARSPVYAPNPAPRFTTDQPAVLLGVDWLFGPTDTKPTNPDRARLTLIRTDRRGRFVFRQAFSVEYEDYGITQAGLVSNAEGALVNVTLGKGLFKYQIAYARITPDGVAWQRIWDKKAPPLVRLGGQMLFRPFEHMQGLIPLPDGACLLLSTQIETAGMQQPVTRYVGYGLLHLSADGTMLRAYAIDNQAPAPLMSLAPAWQVLPLTDGKLLLYAAEARAGASVFSPYSLLDLEVQAGIPPGGLLPDEESFFGVPGQVNAPPTDAAAPRGGGLLGKLAGGLSVIQGRGGSGNEPTKRQVLLEPAPVMTSPVLWQIDVVSGRAVPVGGRSLAGYCLPDAPVLLVNRAQQQLFVPLRTLPQRLNPDQSDPLPQAVYLKMIQLNW